MQAFWILEFQLLACLFSVKLLLCCKAFRAHIFGIDSSIVSTFVFLFTVVCLQFLRPI